MTDLKEVLTQTQAAKALGMSKQSIGMWTKRPDAPVETRKGVRCPVWPDFPNWYHAEIRKEREQTTDINESKARKEAALAELAELDLAVKRGELVPMEHFRAEVRNTVTQLRATVLAMPGRFSSRTVGIATLPASQSVWDAAAKDLLRTLSSDDSDDA